MSWAKLDDGWWCHPKTLSVSLTASGLWARALSWSCQQRRDTVPATFLPLAGADPEHAAELVAAGFWHETEGGWRIHEWEHYQAQSLSEMRAEAGRKGGRKSRPAKQPAEANAKQTRSTPKQTGEANVEAGTRPVPALPNPTPADVASTTAERSMTAADSGVSSRKRSDRATRLPDDWQPQPEPALERQALSVGVDPQRELARFADYWPAQGGARARRVDWQATWRNWLRKAIDDAPGRNGQARASPADRSNAALRGAGQEAWLEGG